MSCCVVPVHEFLCHLNPYLQRLLPFSHHSISIIFSWHSMDLVKGKFPFSTNDQYVNADSRFANDAITNDDHYQLDGEL